MRLAAGHGLRRR
uniref:Uncharacterized protein n=1 Tax=Arundo donax TaxID=35708 RepID=A0A0A9HXK8_ARUDO